MGLKLDAQRRRIQDDEAISDKLVVIKTYTLYKDSIRKKDVAFLNSQALPYWLGTIDAKRVKPGIYEAVVRFKRSFAETAWIVNYEQIFCFEKVKFCLIKSKHQGSEITQSLDYLHTWMNIDQDTPSRRTYATTNSQMRE